MPAEFDEQSVGDSFERFENIELLDAARRSMRHTVADRTDERRAAISLNQFAGCDPYHSLMPASIVFASEDENCIVCAVLLYSFEQFIYEPLLRNLAQQWLVDELLE